MSPLHLIPVSDTVHFMSNSSEDIEKAVFSSLHFWSPEWSAASIDTHRRSRERCSAGLRGTAGSAGYQNLCTCLPGEGCSDPREERSNPLPWNPQHPPENRTELASATAASPHSPSLA
ncbi:hypothetical protein LEMLEM_LOCUS16334, partial [Lemmus lemmus]